MQQIFRQEHKFLIATKEYKKHYYYFSRLLSPDRYSGADGYLIRSLYFDTPEDTDYSDKLDGLETRKKIRLRIYDPNSDFAMLEMKQKQGAEQLKRSLRLSREDAILLTEGVYSPLLNYTEPFATECFAVMNSYAYRPKAIIEYKRQAFAASENNIRITFDRNVTATESCFDLFSNNLLTYPVLDADSIVLEVKYNGFLLSYVKDALNECNKSSLSASKYCLGRSVCLRYI